MYVSVFSRGAEWNAVSASSVHSIGADISYIFPVSPVEPINRGIEAVGLYGFSNSKQDGRELYTPVALVLEGFPPYPLGWRSLCVSQGRLFCLLLVMEIEPRPERCSCHSRIALTKLNPLCCLKLV